MSTMASPTPGTSRSRSSRMIWAGGRARVARFSAGRPGRPWPDMDCRRARRCVARIPAGALRRQDVEDSHGHPVPILPEINVLDAESLPPQPSAGIYPRHGGSASSRCRPDVCAGSTRLGLETTLIIRPDISPGSKSRTPPSDGTATLSAGLDQGACGAKGTDDIIF
jgi:hypothetical protein